MGGRFFMHESHFSFHSFLLEFSTEREYSEGTNSSFENKTHFWLQLWQCPRVPACKISWIKLNWSTRPRMEDPSGTSHLLQGTAGSYLFNDMLLEWEIWYNFISSLGSTWKGLANLSQQIQSILKSRKRWRECSGACQHLPVEGEGWVCCPWARDVETRWDKTKSYKQHCQNIFISNDCFTEKFHPE